VSGIESICSEFGECVILIVFLALDFSSWRGGINLLDFFSCSSVQRIGKIRVISERSDSTSMLKAQVLSTLAVSTKSSGLNAERSHRLKTSPRLIYLPERNGPGPISPPLVTTSNRWRWRHWQCSIGVNPWKNSDAFLSNREIRRILSYPGARFSISILYLEYLMKSSLHSKICSDENWKDSSWWQWDTWPSSVPSLVKGRINIDFKEIAHFLFPFCAVRSGIPVFSQKWFCMCPKDA